MTDKLDVVQLKMNNLVYVSDEEPGYSRRKRGRGFSYSHPDGTLVRDQALRDRFTALVIPPAWTDVWICLEPNGHMQATGRDDANRKQYIYHPQWEEMRNQAKFSRLYNFGQALPQIREKVDSDLRKHNLPREKVLALTVALLDETYMRIGNSVYTEKNDSYGLTTLETEHAEANSSRVLFEFTGKSGVEREIDLRNPRLARLVKACQELPGQRLFQYEDEAGEVNAIDSGDVNAYLRDIGEKNADDEDKAHVRNPNKGSKNSDSANFSAKDFRTWAGTVDAIEILQEIGEGKTEKEREQNIVNAVKEVAATLGNTPAVCRQYYIHPAIFDAYLTGDLAQVYKNATRKKDDSSSDTNSYDTSERATLRLLEKMGYGDN